MLFEHLCKIADQAPLSSGLWVGEKHFSYAYIAKQVERLAAGLLQMGLSSSDRVAILLPNGPEFFTTTYALCAIGAVAVPVNHLSGAAELEWLAKKCNFAAIISANHFLDVANSLNNAANKSVPVLPWNKVQGAGENQQSIEKLLTSTPVQLPTISADSVASYLLSSGSTGRPKLVPHTHAQLIACAKIASTSLKLTPNDIVLNALPAHHAFGFLNGCFEVMSGGASTCYWENSGPLMLSRKRLLALLLDKSISVMPGVPYIFQTLGEVKTPINFPKMRLVYSSGIALKKEIFNSFKQRFNLTLHQGYGCTETGMISLNGVANDSSDQLSPWNSVGRPSKGVQVQLIPQEGQAKGVGELFVNTPALIDGYVDATSAENSAFIKGGYLTGDLGRFDELGNLFIIGRTKLIIEVAGEKVDPFEVEDILCQLPAIDEAVVIGVPDPRTGEQKLKAYIVQSDDIPASEIVAFCRSKLLGFKVPEIIEFIEEIPKSSTGKVLRGKLMQH